MEKDPMAEPGKIAPVGNHREREKGVLVYPVYSRRSKGLSIGVNLFPDKKRCTFDCPYCEVFDFSPPDAAEREFPVGQMEADLRGAVASAVRQAVPIKDICFSGNGEPTLSPYFARALETAAAVRGRLAPRSAIVLITCGSGLLQDETFSLLCEAAKPPVSLDIWLKVDAGSQKWYEKMNRSKIPFESLAAKIKEFAACAPVTIQTMLCKIDGEGPPPQEEEAWEGFVSGLPPLTGGAGVRKVQIYGKARLAQEDPKAQALPAGYLEKRAARLRRLFSVSHGSAQTEVEVYP